MLKDGIFIVHPHSIHAHKHMHNSHYEQRCVLFRKAVQWALLSMPEIDLFHDHVLSHIKCPFYNHTSTSVIYWNAFNVVKWPTDHAM